MMKKEVQKFIESEGLIPSGAKILVALSGGADSVALLCILLDLGYLCEAAHCNFRLRGEESDRDETFVRRLCSERGVSLHVMGFNTSEYASSLKISIEMAARKLRYDWFESLRAEMGAEVIAVAHHRDDSVETLLLNLIRGTGIDGLRGIKPKNGFVVRPLLCVGRKDISDYLLAEGQEYVTDSTNLEDEYTRNKIRLDILPVMERINPSVIRSITTTASHLDQVAMIYEKAVQEAVARVKNECGICISALLKEASPKALLFEILYPMGFNSAQVDSIFKSLKGQSGRRFCAAEWCVLKDREYLIVFPVLPESFALLPAIELPWSGEVRFGGLSRKIKVNRKTTGPDFKIPGGKNFACLDVSKLTFPLILRKWKQGDRFVPFGMKGMKNVSDYLTDRKYSIYEKSQVYVICSGEDIVWIAGERNDNRFKVDSCTKDVIIIELADE